jgi:hypothetical protein
VFVKVYKFFAKMLLSKKNTSTSPSSAKSVSVQPTAANASDLAYIIGSSETVTMLEEVSP